MVKRSYPRRNNVSFVQMLSLANRLELKLFRHIAIKAMKNIGRGEKFYVSYDREYTFANVRSSTERQ